MNAAHGLRSSGPTSTHLDASPDETDRLAATTAALRRAGLTGDAELVTPFGHVAGPAVEWWLLRIGEERAVWVQHLRDPRLRAGAEQAMVRSAAGPNVEDHQSQGVYLTRPVTIAPATYAYVVAPGSRLLAGTLLDLIRADGASRQDWSWLPPLCARLAATLVAVHATAGTATARSGVERENEAVRRVRAVLAPDGPSPVHDALAEFPRLRTALAEAIRRFETEPDPVTLHGRFAPGEMLVTPIDDGRTTPQVYVAGWLETVVGPRAYDVGYFIGELMELAAIAGNLGNQGAAAALHAAATTFYRAYTASIERAQQESFTQQVTDFAAFKIVEHASRFVEYVGNNRAAVDHMLGTADALLNQGLHLLPLSA